MQEIREETEQLARSMNPFPPPFPAIGIDFDSILIVEEKLMKYKYTQIISIRQNCAMKFKTYPPLVRL